MRAYRKALGFAADLADAPMQYDLLLHMAELERARQSPENALGHLDEALEIAERHRSLNRVQRVRAAMGQISLDQEEFEEAREHFEAALSLAREIGDVGEQSICLNALGGLARSRRDPSAAAGFFAQALALPSRRPWRFRPRRNRRACAWPCSHSSLTCGSGRGISRFRARCSARP